MAIAQSPSTRSELSASRGAHTTYCRNLSSVVCSSDLATLALAAIVKMHPGPLLGDAGLTVWWQRSEERRVGKECGFGWVRDLNWIKDVAITIAVVVAIFAVLRRWLDILVLLAIVVADG